MSLLDACKNGNLDAVETFLNNPNADVNETDPYGTSLLSWACINGYCEIVTLFMNHKNFDPQLSGQIMQRLSPDFSPEIRTLLNNPPAKSYLKNASAVKIPHRNLDPREHASL
jgi:ankyrin repeat protein